MVAGGLREEARAVLDRAALGVAGRPVETTDAGKRDRAGAHGAGLERDIEIAADEPFGAEFGRRLPDGEHFGMGRRIAIDDRAVAGDRDDGAAAHERRADRRLAGCGRLAGGLESRRHRIPALYHQARNLYQTPMTDRDKRQGGRPFKSGGGKEFGRGKPRAGKPGGKPGGRDSKPGPAPKAHEGERIAKAMARAGACSRRDAEEWIAGGRVAVNGKVLSSPAFNVTASDRITIDGKPLAARERTRLFLFHKPRGYVTTDHDPEGRETIFDYLAQRHPELPRLMTVGRLDINTEGLLMLTNDGGLARTLELPQTGWLRRYRVRAHGSTDQAALDTLAKGVHVEGVDYAPIEAKLDRVQGANSWLTLSLREGKNREVRRVLGSLGLDVNRLIRVSYGPFQLGEIAEGAVEEVKTRVLREQLGPSLIAQSAADFDAPAKERETPERSAPRGRGEGRTFDARKSDAREFDARKFEKRPYRERDDARPMRGRDDARPVRGQRFERDEAVVDKKTERPKPGSRKHVTTMRAERDDRLKKERVKIERGATEDRRGRAIVVERVIAAEPKAEPDNRNARRFKAEREGERPMRRKPREGAASGRDDRRPSRERGERPFEKRGERRDGERNFAPRGERKFEGRRREASEGGAGRKFEGRGPRRDDRGETGKRFARRDGEKRFSRDERGGDRPVRRGDKPGGERSFGDRKGRDDNRGPRAGGDRPHGRTARSGGEGQRSERPSSERPRDDRPRPERPRPERPRTERPRTERPPGKGAPRKGPGGKPGGPRKPRGRD